jgi:hypothetical protein
MDAAGAGLACGMLTCTVSAQTCCVSAGTVQVVTSCENSATCPDPNSTALHCGSANDCPGASVCCLTQSNNRDVAECRMICGGGDVQLCNPSAQGTDCPQGRQCQPPTSGGLPPLPDGVGVCGG